MDDDAFYESLGPWATQRAVRDALGADDAALESLRKKHELLAVEFAGALYYPLPQFSNCRVIEGLKPVLIALSVGFTSPEAQAAWFAEPAYADDNTRTRWRVLGDGNVSDVVRWAALDAAAVLR